MSRDTESEEEENGLQELRVAWFNRVRKMFDSSEHGLTSSAVNRMRMLVNNITVLFPDFCVDVGDDLAKNLMKMERTRSRDEKKGLETLMYFLYMVGWHLAKFAHKDPNTYGKVMKGMWAFKCLWDFDCQDSISTNAKEFAAKCGLEGAFSGYFVKCIEVDKAECFEVYFPGKKNVVWIFGHPLKSNMDISWFGQTEQDGFQMMLMQSKEICEKEIHDAEMPQLASLQPLSQAQMHSSKRMAKRTKFLHRAEQFMEMLKSRMPAKSAQLKMVSAGTTMEAGISKTEVEKHMVQKGNWFKMQMKMAEMFGLESELNSDLQETDMTRLTLQSKCLPLFLSIRNFVLSFTSLLHMGIPEEYESQAPKMMQNMFNVMVNGTPEERLSLNKVLLGLQEEDETFFIRSVDMFGMSCLALKQECMQGLVYTKKGDKVQSLREQMFDVEDDGLLKKSSLKVLEYWELSEMYLEATAENVMSHDYDGSLESAMICLVKILMFLCGPKSIIASGIEEAESGKFGPANKMLCRLFNEKSTHLTLHQAESRFHTTFAVLESSDERLSVTVMCAILFCRKIQSLIACGRNGGVETMDNTVSLERVPCTQLLRYYFQLYTNEVKTSISDIQKEHSKGKGKEQMPVRIDDERKEVMLQTRNRFFKDVLQAEIDQFRSGREEAQEEVEQVLLDMLTIGAEVLKEGAPSKSPCHEMPAAQQTLLCSMPTDVVLGFDELLEDDDEKAAQFAWITFPIHALMEALSNDAPKFEQYVDRIATIHMPSSIVSMTRTLSLDAPINQKAARDLEATIHKKEVMRMRTTRRPSKKKTTKSGAAQGARMPETRKGTGKLPSAEFHPCSVRMVFGQVLSKVRQRLRDEFSAKTVLMQLDADGVQERQISGAPIDKEAILEVMSSPVTDRDIFARFTVLMQMVCMNKIKEKTKCNLSGSEARDVRNLQISERKVSADVRESASAAVFGAAMQVCDDKSFDEMMQEAGDESDEESVGKSQDIRTQEYTRMQQDTRMQEAHASSAL